MSAVKKLNTGFEDPLNSKIQKKFDLVYGSSEKEINEIEDNQEASMSGSGAKKSEATAISEINLDFSIDDDIPAINTKPEAEAPKTAAEAPSEGLDFSIDFDFNTDDLAKNESPASEAQVASEAPSDGLAIPSFDEEALAKEADLKAEQIKASAPAQADPTGGFAIPDFDEEALAKEADLKAEQTNAAAPIATDGTGGFAIPDFDEEALAKEADLKAEQTNAAAPVATDGTGGFAIPDFDDSMQFDESTKKTIMISAESLMDNNINFADDVASSAHSSADMMSTEEAKANIETTIKEILRPKKLDGTQEFDVSNLTSNPEDDFNLEEVAKAADADEELLDEATNFITATPASFSKNTDTQRRVDISTDDFLLDKEELSKPAISKKELLEDDLIATPVEITRERDSERAPLYSGISDEESMRVQATIRQMREEREELFAQIKELKGEVKELEHDNLSLKANLDEAKIEISILRKRHMVEIEDIKYRLTMSEEKKALAEERARQADLRREKLEQKVRIDFNQVKQREKELESKLELLSMDVDSQVHSRDQKILELRRKIDALEFNMENASIKEQKSLDDKRKLEDKLNKIMKTLRNSIKNLEDDIDLASEDDVMSEKNK